MDKFKNKNSFIGLSIKDNKTMTNKLNTHFNSIGNNALKNAETSVGIIEELTLQNSKGTLKVKGNSIYTLLGVKNGAGIISQLKGIKSLNALTIERKKIVNKLILPKAELNHLVEVEKTATPKPKAKTKKEKKETTAEKKQVVEMDNAFNKSNESVKNNAIRTTANNVVFPFIFLASQDSKNYAFENGKIKINTRNLAKDVCQSVFGFNKEKADVGFMYCNLTMIIKLAKAVLFHVEIMQSTETTETAEELEDAVNEMSKGELDETKEKNIVSSITSMLNYLDKNNGFDGILQIENHIFTLDNYGQAKQELTNNVRKQTNNAKNYDLIGSVAVEFNHSKDFKVNTFDELETQFNKTFAIK